MLHCEREKKKRKTIRLNLVLRHFETIYFVFYGIHHNELTTILLTSKKYIMVLFFGYIEINFITILNESNPPSKYGA